MADSIQPQPAICDGKDHGATPVRLAQLQDEAHAFNQLLRVNEADAHGKNHENQVAGAKKAFYNLTLAPASTESGLDNSNGGRAFEASKALYEQASQLPVGERRALLKAVLSENTANSSTDQALPRVSVNMDSDAFIESLDVKYPLPIYSGKDGKAKSYGVGEEFTFHYLGMCAEFKTPEPNDPPIVTNNMWSITMPTFNFR